VPLTQSHRITPRRPRFDFGATPAHWLADDALGAHMLNLMQVLTPAPERWFCRSFRDALPQVRDERLRAAAQAFIKQEGAHSHGHTLALRRLEQQGIDLGAYCAFLDWLFDRMLGPAPLGRELKDRRAQRAWLKTRLAMVAATEHMTTVLGHWVLNARALDAAPLDPAMLDLYRWHGAEEVEHREVAEAMLRHFSGSYALRAGAALFIFPLFAVLAWSSAAYVVRQDPDLPHRLRLRDYLRLARQGRIPGPGEMVRAGLRYFRPRHAAVDEGNTAQALAYLARAATGADGSEHASPRPFLIAPGCSGR
jgi:predicted metal-dependent hydrolase